MSFTEKAQELMKGCGTLIELKERNFICANSQYCSRCAHVQVQMREDLQAFKKIIERNLEWNKETDDISNALKVLDGEKQ